jgi:hypothetical protein
MPTCPRCGERFTLVEPHDCRSGFRLPWAVRVVLAVLAVLLALLALLWGLLWVFLGAF